MRQLVGFVVLLCLVVTGATLAWKEDVFASRAPIYIVTDNALGISKGIPVKVFGLTVGTVDDIEIVPGGQGQVRVRLDIASDYLQYINDHTVKPVARDGAIAFERRRSLVDLPTEMKRTFSLGEEAAPATVAAPAAASATPATP